MFVRVGDYDKLKSVNNKCFFVCITSSTRGQKETLYCYACNDKLYQNKAIPLCLKQMLNYQEEDRLVLPEHTIISCFDDHSPRRG